MALKTFKPYTKSTRGTVIVAKQNLWKGKPIKLLTMGKKTSSGRNNFPNAIRSFLAKRNASSASPFVYCQNHPK